MKKLNQKICEEFSKGNFEFAFPYLQMILNGILLVHLLLKAKKQ